MTAPEIPVDRNEPWTFDDLRKIPDSSWRFEIIEGGLYMTPPPGLWHQTVCSSLERVIAAAIGPTSHVLGPVAVDIHPTYLVPDLSVASARAARADPDRVPASELSLVVEVVSAGSMALDRLLKPAKYAAAGIPAFWLVETEPRASLTAFTLTDDATVYTEVGTWMVGEVAHLTEPFQVDIPISDLEG
ncbi:Uma2 family endonuclease [Phytoactinopolyspora limicola]|uniref:Uma2 family endonuclease n=1 Tax=Phytoactinopolyspora limicola TaxID=2715536 RepID=UPI00140E409C|nr:Uma2 family endonuclease [Phytoactinopolyspora limicola]